MKQNGFLVIIFPIFDFEKSTFMKNLFSLLLVVIIGTGAATFSQTQKTEAQKSSLAQWIHSNGSGNFTETETKSLNNKPIWIESGHFNFEEMSRTKFEVLLKDLNGRNEMQIKIENNACFWKYSNEINWIPLYNGGWVVNPTIDSSLNTGVNNIKDDNNTPLSITNTLISQNIKPLPNNSSNENEVMDFDGNIYKTVRIRDKIWITEDLKTTHFNDGKPIPLVEEINSWIQLNSPAYCTPPPFIKNTNDGLLYNHYVVENNNVCPQGFKVPTKGVVDSMIEYYSKRSHLFDYFIYSESNVGYGNYEKNKNCQTSGFNFLKGGHRVSVNDGGLYYNPQGYSEYYPSFWLKDRASKFDDETNSFSVLMVDKKIEMSNIKEGHYIRCYKDYVPSKPQLSVTTMKDNSGNNYKTVKIGNQIWMAEDLQLIPEKTRVVFNEEEEAHYTGSVFHDNFKSSGPLNFSEDHFIKEEYGESWAENKTYFNDVCPQGWHLPDQAEWEIMLRNCELKDIKSTTGWNIYKIEGYYSKVSVPCPNCKNGTQAFIDRCTFCKGQGKIFKKGKYNPERIINENGTNKMGLNLKPYPYYDGAFKITDREVSYWIRDHCEYGAASITFSVIGDKVEFNVYDRDHKNYAHVRCIKD
jgi:uncharacterized protein (TIGR02145 family)